MTELTISKEPLKSPLKEARDQIVQIAIMFDDRAHLTNSGTSSCFKRSKRLIAQQTNISTKGSKECLLNLTIAADFDAVNQFQIDFDKVDQIELTLSDRTIGRPVFQIGLEKDLITITDQGLLKDVHSGKTPDPKAKATFRRHQYQLNGQYSSDELLPLKTALTLLDKVTQPNVLWDAAVRSLPVVPPPKELPIDKSTPPKMTRKDKPELFISSFPDRVSNQEREWSNQVLNSVTPEVAILWFAQSLRAMSNRQLQVIRQALSRKNIEDLRELTQAVGVKDRENLHNQLTKYVTTDYLNKAAYAEELTRDFNFHPDPAKPTLIAHQIDYMRQIREALKELAGDNPDMDLNNYLLGKKQVKERTLQSNRRFSTKKASSAEEFFETMPARSQETAEVQLWEKIYQLIQNN